MIQEDDIINNIQLQKIIEDLTSPQEVKSTIQKMIPFASIQRHTESLMRNDTREQIIIFKDPGSSFIIERKSDDQMIQELKEYRLLYKKIEKNQHKQGEFSKNMDIFESFYTTTDKNKNLDENFLQILQKLSNKREDNKWKLYLEHNQIDHVFFNNICLYQKVAQIQPGDVFTSITNNQNKIIIVPDEIQTINFKMKSIQIFFQKKIQKMKEQYTIFQRIFGNIDSYLIKNFLLRVKEQEYKPKQIIYQIDDPCSNIYVVAQGEVLIKKIIDQKKRNFQNNLKTIALLSQGSLFGENNEDFRSCQAESQQQSLIYVFEKHYFFYFVQDHHIQINDILQSSQNLQKDQIKTAQKVQIRQDKTNCLNKIKHGQSDEIRQLLKKTKIKKKVLSKALGYKKIKNTNLQDIDRGQINQDMISHERLLRQITTHLNKRNEQPNYITERDPNRINQNIIYQLQNQKQYYGDLNQNMNNIQIQKAELSNRSLQRGQSARTGIQKSNSNQQVNPIFSNRSNDNIIRNYSLSKTMNKDKISIQEYKQKKSQQKRAMSGLQILSKTDSKADFNLKINLNQHHTFVFPKKINLKRSQLKSAK